MGEKKFHCKACGIDCPFNGNVKPCVSCPDGSSVASAKTEEKCGRDFEFGGQHIFTASFVRDVFDGNGKKLGRVMIAGGRYSFTKA